MKRIPSALMAGVALAGTAPSLTAIAQTRAAVAKPGLSAPPTARWSLRRPPHCRR
jgi:hypothetical protein